MLRTLLKVKLSRAVLAKELSTVIEMVCICPVQFGSSSYTLLLSKGNETSATKKLNFSLVKPHRTRSYCSAE